MVMNWMIRMEIEQSSLSCGKKTDEDFKMIKRKKETRQVCRCASTKKFGDWFGGV